MHGVPSEYAEMGKRQPRAALAQHPHAPLTRMVKEKKVTHDGLDRGTPDRDWAGSRRSIGFFRHRRWLSDRARPHARQRHANSQRHRTSGLPAAARGRSMATPTTIIASANRNNNCWPSTSFPIVEPMAAPTVPASAKVAAQGHLTLPARQWPSRLANAFAAWSDRSCRLKTATSRHCHQLRAIGLDRVGDRAALHRRRRSWRLSWHACRDEFGREPAQANLCLCGDHFRCRDLHAGAHRNSSLALNLMRST